MRLPGLILGSPQWMAVAIGLAGLATLGLLWSYVRTDAKRSVRIAAAALKALGFAALAISLLEPLLTGTKPRRGANAFVILADNSQSLQIRDGNGTLTNGDWMRGLLSGESEWKTRLGQDYDVRNYIFDTHLRAAEGFDGLTFDGTGSAIGTSLDALAKRFRGLPLAGVLIFSDGNRTDLNDIDVSSLPPIYPIIPPSAGVSRDVGVNQISINQTNFESAPVVLRADISTVGLGRQSVVAELIDESGKQIERQTLAAVTDGKPLSFRFQFRPEHRGVSFYRVEAFPAGDEQKTGQDGKEQRSTEQTVANNSRLVVVDQGGGPFRVLYVSGRPNWEFKFLRRAVEEDKDIELVGLVRIARRKPKFDFRQARSQPRNSLFDGFDHPDSEMAEQPDQPVLIRLGTLDGAELRDGFPKAADELYRYHGIIIDDLEASFFTPDQQALLRSFVSQRGGGLLMLGGPDSFADGKYDRTPVGELLPVYLNRPSTFELDGDYRLVLTREGWLQPWVRLRKTEDEEKQRLAGMSAFQTLSQSGNVKPGAVVLSEVQDNDGKLAPALVAHSYGRGHVAALLIGDLWRWEMGRENQGEDDFDRSWRQTVRWLVGDVPNRVEVAVRPKPDSGTAALRLVASLRDAEYRPLDNGRVSFRIKLPNGEEVTLDAEPDEGAAGAYAATFVPRLPGAYRFKATAAAPDGSLIGEREAGWVAQPVADEFVRLQVNREFLGAIAAKTRGEIVDGDRLPAFVASLSNRSAPITEPWTSPLWQQPLYFLIAIGCLLGEWGLRRVNGLP